MPYDVDNPPAKLRNLPKPGQEAWVKAFNAAFVQYKGDEGRASRVAWAAVDKTLTKLGYRKNAEGEWVKMADAELEAEWTLEPGAIELAEDMVSRSGKLLEAGSYPAKGLEEESAVTEDDLEDMVATFAEPQDIELQHVETLFDGALGKLARVWKKGKELFGEVRVPRQVDDLLRAAGKAMTVSLSFLRERPRKILGLGLVTNPAVVDAVLMALNDGAFHAGGDKIELAEWTAKYVNDLPDSCFLHIEPGGEKDEEGKTVPRGLRHFPVKDISGKVDMPHLRNALARIPQSDLSQGVKDAATAKARKMLESMKEEMGIDIDDLAEKLAVRLQQTHKEGSMEGGEKGIVAKALGGLLAAVGLKKDDIPVEEAAPEPTPSAPPPASAVAGSENPPPIPAAPAVTASSGSTPDLVASMATVSTKNRELEETVKKQAERIATMEAGHKAERIEAKLDALEQEGNLIPAARPYARVLLSGEKGKVQMSKEGKTEEVEVGVEEAAEQLIKLNRHVDFSERAASPEHLDTTGMTPEQVDKQINDMVAMSRMQPGDGKGEGDAVKQVAAMLAKAAGFKGKEGD